MCLYKTINFIIHFQYIPIIIAHFLLSLLFLFLFHFDDATVDTTYVSSLEAVVASTISPAVTTSPATTNCDSDCDRDQGGDTILS